jgi:hypothetical protein
MNSQPTIVTHEMGLEATALPTWTDDGRAIDLDSTPVEAVSRIIIPEVPGAFQLLNVLSIDEADTFIEQTERLGFHKDSPVSLPYSVRHNDNLNWVVSENIDQTIWQRSKKYVVEKVNGQTAKGINARFRFYRYNIGDFFNPHTDGSWTGSRVINGELIANAYPHLYSQFSYLIFLNDDYEGGRTQFLVSKTDPNKPATSSTDTNIVSVNTPKGAALCFPHGMHPLHCVHSSEPISVGTKYIIRTDILFGD